jgi:hypothetical protein
MRRIACALVHHPVLDRGGTVVTSAITNIDLHDISRSALSFGLTDFFVIHPVEAQRTLALRIRSHWVEGSGGKRIPDRMPALGAMRVVSSLRDAVEDLGEGAAHPVELWTTAARPGGASPLTFVEGRARIIGEGPPILVCFGTGWGLAPELHAQAAFQLEPIRSPRADGYNHLSVRAAAAIVFDRLLGVG